MTVMETYILFCKKGSVESGHYHCFVCNDPYNHFVKLCTQISKVCLSKPNPICSTDISDNPVENTSVPVPVLVPVPAQETVKSNDVACAQCREEVLKIN